jgi:DNA-binding transcriptional regulator YiaG
LQSSKTALERAFELARSGKYRTLRELTRELKSEGYSDEHIEGRQIRTQLLRLLKVGPVSAAERLQLSALTPAQVKAARQMLGWSISALASRVRVSTSTLQKFEAAQARYSTLDLDLVREALECAGVEFITVGGAVCVGLRKTGI